MPEFRTYRNKMHGDRFVSFVISVYETDCWFGIDKSSYDGVIKTFIYNKIKYYRKIISEYIDKNPLFLKSYVPVSNDKKAHPFIQQMIECSGLSNTGPMSAVAGAFSEFIGKDIEKEFNPNELVIENGGDIYLNVKNEFISLIYAGKSSLSQKVGLVIPAEFTPLGICTSSGTVGHSKSFGNADAVTIAAKNTLIADVFATAYCNKVKNEKDMEMVLQLAKNNPHILSCVVIFNDKIGIIGKFKATLYNV
jgi:ApbE superfamily uncharacterized protein (UPF0280 family)